MSFYFNWKKYQYITWLFWLICLFLLGAFNFGWSNRYFPYIEKLAFIFWLYFYQGSPIFDDEKTHHHGDTSSSDDDISDDYYEDEYYEYGDQYTDTSDSRGQCKQ